MRLTERDFDLLRYLAEQGVASSRQLAEKFFPTQRALQTRVAILAQQGLIESVPLTAMKAFSQQSYFHTATDLLGASRSDIWKYRIYRLGERFKKKWPSTAKLADVKMWRHQLMVNEIRSVFEKKFPDALFLNDPQVLEEWRHWANWKSGDFSDVPIPDLTVRVGDLQIAIEIERNLKAETTYFTRFIRYESSQYSHVLYYCESERVFKTVSKLARSFEWMAFARFGTIHEIYRLMGGWTKLDAFLEERQWRERKRP